MSAKIYPAIYESVSGEEYLYADKDNYYSYERKSWDKAGYCDCHESDTNITHEYLENTYGKVKSREHAEFIKLLAETHGVVVFKDCESTKPKVVSHFSVTSDGVLYFWCGKAAIQCDRELITIPLPPKQMQTSTSEEESEMNQSIKNNGDNLILGCEESKVEEWPQIGDEVLAIGNKCTVMSLADNHGCLAVMSERGFNMLVYKSDIKKPKTPEEELLGDILDCDNFSITESKAAQLTKWLTDKYNITKKK